jgi:hypothetical protein
MDHAALRHEATSPGRTVLEAFYRLAATGIMPRRLFAPPLPAPPPALPPDTPLRLEIVSHCWRYGRFLAYQLASLVRGPPRDVAVTMTVFYSTEDRETVDVLDRFGVMDVPGVTWNWQALDRHRLFRRAIGRNLAARATTAHWIWFSDCDVLFRDHALDTAARALRGRDDVLLFPREHRVSAILERDHALLARADQDLTVLDIDPAEFQLEVREKAVGGFQIVRGDVARALGYCGDIAFYQEPVPRWQKTYEDRTFRWLLGTHGTPIEVPGLYRIRHAEKGRDAPPAEGRSRLSSKVRGLARRFKQRRGGRRQR